MKKKKKQGQAYSEFLALIERFHLEQSEIMLAVERREQAPSLWSWPCWPRLALRHRYIQLAWHLLPLINTSIGTLCEVGLSPVKQD